MTFYEYTYRYETSDGRPANKGEPSDIPDGKLPDRST